MEGCRAFFFSVAVVLVIIGLAMFIICSSVEDVEETNCEVFGDGEETGKYVMIAGGALAVLCCLECLFVREQ